MKPRYSAPVASILKRQRLTHQGRRWIGEAVVAIVVLALFLYVSGCDYGDQIVMEHVK